MMFVSADKQLSVYVLKRIPAVLAFKLIVVVDAISRQFTVSVTQPKLV